MLNTMKLDVKCNEDRLDRHGGDVKRLSARLNAHAEDIHSITKRVTEVAEGVIELTHRTEALFNDSGLHAKHIGELVRHIDKLELERAGNDRTFREVISDNEELARHIEGLGERASSALHERARAEVERDKLEQRIGRLERLLEKEAKNNDYQD